MESKMVTKLAPGGGSLQKLVKSDRSMFMSSDDSAMMKQIQGTHSPDGFEIDVKPLLLIVEDILSRATLMPTNAILMGDQEPMENNLEDKANQVGVTSMLEALSYTIDRLACEMACKCLGSGDGHQTTFSLFNVLSSYSWDAKLVLTLAAFALNYGEFWLLAQIYSSNQLAKSMATLKQLPVIMEHSGSLKPRFDALNNLIKAMLELTRCIVALKELPSAYVSHEVPALTAAMATVPTAVYWTIRGIVACATQIASLTSMGHEFAASTTESWELSTLAHKINNIHDHLEKQLDMCYQLIEEKRNVEAYEALLHIFEMIHIDNMKVLKAIIYAKDDLQPLFDGSTKRRVTLDVLRRKNVLLLISGLDISQDELSILEQIYSESRQHATRLDNLYEVVWVPIVDYTVQWSDPMKRQFETLQSAMPWYTVHHPSLIDRAVVRFVRERWHFRNKPILVVLDPQGRVVSPNAIHMMWIWGSNAFPFTSLREEALWKTETWRLELLVDGVDQTILNWIKEGKYIFMYGGDDIEWIRRFTTTARNVAQAARIPLEMVYVGKSSKKEQVRRVINTITLEKLSYTWQDLMVWFFWTRLESMLFSKIQLGKADDHDPMMQEVKKLLSYDKSGCWAVLSKGPDVVVNGHSTTMLPTLDDYDMWKEHVTEKGFDRSFKEHHDMHHGRAHPCCRFEFSSTAGRIPSGMKCPQCLRPMDKYTTFICCHDEETPDRLY
ncbi:Protein SIEVE ELEMENT OCCLUSION B like [Actinidia chinensis var. chinensis]|uniref:Protein SIEVE ELEMENT OCCLUSION B like n=1 Tax=Actinidia chinensis var. chinensis TaxID=1590841 RepID=A0A2R6P9P5_ACTCC|nr:Protein SIEVE ELEMENT OCCLUSION B like [Actinidia chinensis var. chinensis]